jgi:hypothetical protein
MKHTPKVVYRDSRDGQFVPKPWAQKHPAITERIPLRPRRGKTRRRYLSCKALPLFDGPFTSLNGPFYVATASTQISDTPPCAGQYY